MSSFYILDNNNKIMFCPRSSETFDVNTSTNENKIARKSFYILELNIEMNNG